VRSIVRTARPICFPVLFHAEPAALRCACCLHLRCGRAF